MAKDELSLDEVLDSIPLDEARKHIQVAEKAEDSAEVSRPTDAFVKVLTADFLFYTRLFSSCETSFRDILSRSGFFKTDESRSSIRLFVSDGVFQGSVNIPVIEASSSFPESFVLDFESLVRVSKFAGKFLYLIHSDGSFYVDVFGGRVHIPSYIIKEGIVKVDVWEKTHSFHSLSAIQFHGAISAAHEYLMSNQLMNFDYAFFTPEGHYSFNGYSVFRGNFVFPKPCVFRKLDLPYIQSLSLISGDQNIEVGFSDSRVELRTASVKMSLPLVNEVLPSTYIEKWKQHTRAGTYSLEFTKLQNLLSAFSKVYRSSGVVSLRSDGGTLFLETKSLDDKKSYVVLSRVCSGDVGEFNVTFPMEGLASLLRCLKQSEVVSLSVKGGEFSLSNSLAEIFVFGSLSLAGLENKKAKRRSCEEKEEVD